MRSERGFDRFVAECRSPAETSSAIRDGVARSLGAHEAEPLRGTLPLIFGLEFISTTMAANCALVRQRYLSFENQDSMKAWLSPSW